MRDHPHVTRAAHVVGIYAGALVCGWLGVLAKLPLPWLIGAMLFSAGLRLAGREVAAPRMTRPLGQVLIASSVGLAFTPEAVAAVAALSLTMVVAALLTVVAGFAAAWLLMRLSGIDVISATLASVPIGPVETANLAQRHGVEPGPVVFAQTLRIMLLVLFIPPIIVWLDGNVQDPVAAMRDTGWNPAGALLLFALALGGALLARRVRLSNPFFLGALAGAAGAAALSLPITAYPYPVLVAAQVFLGVWLGAVCDRALVARAGRFVPAALVSTLVLIALCAAMGLALTAVTGVSWPVMVLATAPGSVTEMALTAKLLQEGVALVTAFHVLRIFIIMPAAPLMFGLVARLSQGGRGPDGG